MGELDLDPVSEYYKQNKETEELLYDGNELRDGMVVLIADSMFRRHLHDNPTEGNLQQILEKNRWCRISRVEVQNGIVHFFADYADGQRVKRSYNATIAWLVKKDSIPEPENVENTDTKIIEVVATVWTTFPQVDGSTLLVVKDELGNAYEIKLPMMAADFVSSFAKINPKTPPEKLKSLSALLNSDTDDRFAWLDPNKVEFRKNPPIKEEFVEQKYLAKQELPRERPYDGPTESEATQTRFMRTVDLPEGPAIVAQTNTGEDVVLLPGGDVISPSQLDTQEIKRPLFISPDPTEGEQDSAGE